MDPQHPQAPAAHGGKSGDRRVAVRHIRFGWWTLLLYLTLGIALETMHGFKLDWYLAPANETRRTMFRLAHAHGTLWAVVNLVFGVWLGQLQMRRWPLRPIASASLLGGSVLLPAAFLLGGVRPYGGDPGLATPLLAPLAACLLFISVLCIASRSVWRES